MSSHSTKEHMSPEEGYHHDLRHYTTGLILAIILTVIPFGLVAWGGMSYTAAMVVVGILGVIQIVVHVYYFLHVDLSPEKQDELHLILFSGLLLAIMVLGTVWVLLDLRVNMMSYMYEHMNM